MGSNALQKNIITIHVDQDYQAIDKTYKKTTIIANVHHAEITHKYT